MGIQWKPHSPNGIWLSLSVPFSTLSLSAWMLSSSCMPSASLPSASLPSASPVRLLSSAASFRLSSSAGSFCPALLFSLCQHQFPCYIHGFFVLRSRYYMNRSCKGDDLLFLRINGIGVIPFCYINGFRTHGL